MNILKYYFIFFCLITDLYLYAQQGQVDSCGTPEMDDILFEGQPWYGNNIFLDQFHTSAGNLFTDNINTNDGPDDICLDVEGVYLIPIRFWIYRLEDDDPGMPTDLELQRMMDRLNFLYQSRNLNVRFMMVCPQYQTNPEMANLGDKGVFWQSVGGNRDDDAINVYIVNDIEDAAGYYDSFNDAIVVERFVYRTFEGATTLAHEIGHFFGLEHTHRKAGKGRCKAEAVSRTRTFPTSCLKGGGRICEKNGDALCDTPADPNLIWGEQLKVGNDCRYNWGETDNWGDVFLPDESNIMSYAPRSCRSSFSRGQINIVGYNIKFNRLIFQVVDLNETDPDKYEPDDSDFPNVPRPIAVGETQCHSFYDLSDCQDPVDWLITRGGGIGLNRIKIENAGAAPNPVEKVRVWNIGADQRRSTEVSVTQTTVGTATIFEFPCAASGTSSKLIEVVRKSGTTEGLYKITFESSIPLSISGPDKPCIGSVYSVVGLPSGANVVWTSSFNIVLANLTGTSNTIVGNAPIDIPYWIQVTVFYEGCSQTIRKTFIPDGLNGIPDFDIRSETPACYPGFGEYHVLNPSNGITYTWSCDGYACGNIFSYGNGESAVVLPSSAGGMSLTVTATDACGGTRIRSLDVTVPECLDGINMLTVTPNPSAGDISVSIGDSFLDEGSYHVLVINQISEIKYQGDHNSRNFTMNLSALHDGIYKILVFRGQSSKSATFTINR